MERYEERRVTIGHVAEETLLDLAGAIEQLIAAGQNPYSSFEVQPRGSFGLGHELVARWEFSDCTMPGCRRNATRRIEATPWCDAHDYATVDAALAETA